MKKATTSCLVVIFAVLMFALSVAEAQGLSPVYMEGRGGKWEMFIPLSYVNSSTISGQNGSHADINSDWGLGFGGGYNVNDNFQINGTFTWAYRSYEATIVQSDGASKKYNNFMDSATLSMNGVFYLLKGNITPFVSGGVGFTYVDTNIPTSPSSTVCYWDPWWGYVCGGYAPTKTENDLSYNAGVGVRYDVNRKFGMQAGYYKMWIDYSKAGSMPDFDSWRFDFIFRL